MFFRQLIDFETNTFSYLVADEKIREAIIIDPVLEKVERDWQLIQRLGFVLKYSIETHLHADHITSGSKLRELSQCKTVVPQFAKADCADVHLQDGEIIQFGEINLKAIFTPGHTDSHNCYLLNNKILFTGDSLFIGGCGRTDFQSGSAELMYKSIIENLFTLPDETFIYPGHDYRGFTCSTIGEEKANNPRFKDMSLAAFVNLMNNLNLPNPKKIMEAVPANEKCGREN